MFRPRNAFEALTFDELLPKAGLTLMKGGALSRIISLMLELETWPKRYPLPGLEAEADFATWCSFMLKEPRPSARRSLERLAKEQGPRFQKLASVIRLKHGWLAAAEVTGSSLPETEHPEFIGGVLTFIQRFGEARGGLAPKFLEALQAIAPDLLSAKERKLREQEVDKRALSSGEGFGEYLKRRAAAAKSPVHGLVAVLKEAGDPDAEAFSTPDVLNELSRAAVEWLVDGHRPELEDVDGDWLAGQFKAVQRAKAFPKVILKRAEEARLHPAPFGLTGARSWDVQPARPSSADVKALAACPECNRRVKPSQVFHVPALDKGTQGRTLRFYECERCDRAMLFARAAPPARPTKSPANVFIEYEDPQASGKPYPRGFVPWRFERFVTRQHQGPRLALQFGGLPVSQEGHEPAMALRCKHPSVTVRIHTRHLDLQPAYGGSFMLGGVCMTPGCKKPDVRTENDD
ncbi:hypothetical protein [Corallococcus silvisoli]|uniref:hypothetical protein n=1 Tax=Corallococcus silvisoli TaxID=2697031 RepID=UPI00191BF99D|nr:hypothetical protein [Corallococcus silvisoli]